MSVFDRWTCVFPGKMGLSWKRAWPNEGTKEEAEAVAVKNCNVIAVPVQLFDKMKEHERRMVAAELVVQSSRVFAIEALMAHLDAAGRVVSDGVTWTKPSETSQALHRLVKLGKTVDEIEKMVGEKAYGFPDLMTLSSEQLAELDKVCPRTADLTTEILHQVMHN